jgi:alkylation response protein AidB-like acyl-CoA dehydrogenase
VRPVAQAQLIPTALCEEAAAVFADLLLGRAGRGLTDEYFSRDWSLLWDELARDGWTAIGDPADGQFSLLDLTAFAGVWGRFLVPLPFVSTLAVRRRVTAADPRSRLSYVVAEPEAALVPHGLGADLVLTADGLVPAAALPEMTGSDDWAASAPVAIFPAGLPPASAEAAGESAILAAAEAVGAAAEVLRRSVEYAKLREQFGQPIGRFQAIKHRLANMHCRIELATSALAWACFEPDDITRALQSALADCLVVAEQAVQVHGGIGYTWEAAPHRFYRHVMSMGRIVNAAVGPA